MRLKPAQPDVAPIPECLAPFISIRHPGYFESENELLRLPPLDAASDADETDAIEPVPANGIFGVHHATALVACQLIAGNSFEIPYLSYDRAGLSRVKISRHGILTQADYYFQIAPGCKRTYPITPTFDDWRFPHGALPQPWASLPRPTRLSAASSRCIVTGAGPSTVDSVHVVPEGAASSKWFLSNCMGIYSPGDYTYTAIDSPSNSFRLRSDIHNDFDACAFAVVPKPTSAGDPHALAVHFIHIDDDLQDSAARFHNQLIRDPNVPPEYLFARFAYAVFKLIKPFVTTGTRRRLAVMAGGKEDWKTSIHDMELKKREGLFSSDVSRSSRTSKHEQASETESTIDDDYKLPGALSYQSTGDEETLNSTHVPQSIGCDEEAPLEPKHIGTSIWSSVWSGTTDKDTHTSLSVLEYLDIKNPRIKYTGQRKYSIGDDSHLLLCPTQLQPWHEFNFDTIESIYKGALWRAAYEQNFSGPAYPTLSDQDCLITSEYTTACLITKWNGRIVQHALGHSGNQFNSCKWNAPRNPGDKRTSIFKYFCREEPSISTPQADSEITTSGVKTRHNADTTLTCPTNGASCPCSSIERLPKEYVLGSMWNSRDAISHGVTKMGQVKSSKRLSDKMYPIRKAYTYCARFGCRYGCILSTEEAFIFRIRPLSSQPGSTTDYGFFNERNKLLDGLSENGVMEYVSIPWQTPNDEDELNYNVALWFIHVLAANNFEVGWNYPPLVDEIVRENFCMEIPSTGGVDRQN